MRILANFIAFSAVAAVAPAVSAYGGLRQNQPPGQAVANSVLKSTQNIEIVDAALRAGPGANSPEVRIREGMTLVSELAIAGAPAANSPESIDARARLNLELELLKAVRASTGDDIPIRWTAEAISNFARIARTALALPSAGPGLPSAGNAGLPRMREQATFFQRYAVSTYSSGLKSLVSLNSNEFVACRISMPNMIDSPEPDFARARAQVVRSEQMAFDALKALLACRADQRSARTTP